MSSSTIGDHVELQRGTTYKSVLLGQPGPILLGLGSIERDGGFRTDKLKTYGGSSPEKLLVYPGDLYVSLKDVTQSGDLLGSVARVPDTVAVGRMTQDTVKLCFKTDIHKGYFYWLLRTPQYRQHCRSHATGTTNLGLSRDDFFAFKIPELDSIRGKITDILEKIEQRLLTNRQINQTLEEMAQAIFKSWFVDFEPVKAKIEAKENGQDPERAAMCVISGKTNDELDQLTPEQFAELTATAGLFPEVLVDSELCLIPKGWRAGNVGNIVKRLKPKKRYTKKQVVEYGSVPVYEQGASIILGYHNDEPGFNGSPEEPLFIFGDHTCVCHLSCAPFDISQNVIPLSGKKYPTLWVYYAVKDKQKFQEYRRHWSELIIKEVIEPKIEICQFFSETVTKLYQKKEQLVRENNTLRQLRDTLLPKLLLGKIDLKQNQ